MNAVTVNTLRVRARPEDSSRAAFGIGDALRTGITQSDRLVLMRKLRLDRRASSNSSTVRSNAVKTAFLDELDNACHATSFSAANANCVWFSSKTEARRILLERLLKGLPVDGWFWRLAVPEWQGKALDDWVGTRMEEAFARSDTTILKDLIEEFDRHGALAKLVTILLDRQNGIASLSHGFSAGSIQHIDEYQPAFSKADNSKRTDRAARKLLARLPQPMQRFLQLLAADGFTNRLALEYVSEQITIQVAPALRLDKRELAAISLEIIRLLQTPGPANSKRPEKAVCDTSASKHDAKSVDKADQNFESIRPLATLRGKAASVKYHGRKLEKSSVIGRSVEEAFQPEDVAWGTGLLKSQAAGLWLVIPAMIHCGWREWLIAKTELLADDPGRLLLRCIAQHHRVADDDNALLPLGEPLELDGIPEWAYMWRRAIDGWLYRKSRVRLHNLIWRPGKIGVEEERLDIHFPVADADMRLRRHALDVDPGWTDWLGLCVRYHFDGETVS